MHKKTIVKKIQRFKENFMNNTSKKISTWNQILETFDATKPMKDLKVMADFLEFYSKEENQEKSPFVVAIEVGNLDFIKLIRASPFDIRIGDIT